MLFVLLFNTDATRVVCNIGKRMRARDPAISYGVRRLVRMRMKLERQAELSAEPHRMFYYKMRSGIRCQKVRTMERKSRAHWFYRELDSHELKLEYIYSKLITNDQLLNTVALRMA